MLERILDPIAKRALTEEDLKRIEAVPLKLNSAGFDPWGIDVSMAKRMLVLVKWLYTHYFRVETTGIERIPKGRVMLVANHGGQLPFDGLLVGLATFFEGNPPRIVRGMVERWVPTLPFIGSLFPKIGQVVGDPKNCRDLLENDEAILVFPEGVKGSGKPFSKRYQLQRFGTGFVRLALEAKCPIVPVAIVGSEEIFPAIGHSKLLAKLMGAPYFPITPFFPLLGPLGAVPLPAKIRIRFAEPLRFDADADVSDAEVQKMVDEVTKNLRNEIALGLEERGMNWFR